MCACVYGGVGVGGGRGLERECILFAKDVSIANSVF